MIDEVKTSVVRRILLYLKRKLILNNNIEHFYLKNRLMSILLNHNRGFVVESSNEKFLCSVLRAITKFTLEHFI